MLPLFDVKWATLAGGHRVPYDPSAALAKLEQGQDVWEELWNELHHQLVDQQLAWDELYEPDGKPESATTGRSRKAALQRSMAEATFMVWNVDARELNG